MVFIRENNTLLLSFSDKILSWDREKQHNSLEEITTPAPLMPENLTQGQIEVINKEKRSVTWMEISKNEEYIAVTMENKQLVVFNKTFQVVKNILLTRVSSKVCFTPENDILVADRTGDVYQYKIADDKNQPILLLGHLSVILDMVVTHCGKYIITCDRDEKIRVSCYPNAYNIVSFCLGHTEFVKNLKLLENNRILLSASGDGTIRVWDYLQGKEMTKIETKDLAGENVLQDFSKLMDAEKVDVTILPITDMQIYEKGHNVMIIISLYNVNKLNLYKLDSATFKYKHITEIDANSTNFSFYISQITSKLYIFYPKTVNLMVFEFVEDMALSLLSDSFIREQLEKYKEFFEYDNNGITLLYKRKFDNVQEYMERKKQRLESK